MQLQAAQAKGAAWQTYGMLGPDFTQVAKPLAPGVVVEPGVANQVYALLVFGLKPAQGTPQAAGVLPFNASSWNAPPSTVKWKDNAANAPWTGVNVPPIVSDARCLEESSWLSARSYSAAQADFPLESTCVGPRCEGAQGYRAADYRGARDGPLQDAQGNPSFATGDAFGAECACDGWQPNPDGSRVPMMRAYDINRNNDSSWWQCVPDPCWSPEVPSSRYDPLKNACSCSKCGTLDYSDYMTKKVYVGSVTSSDWTWVSDTLYDNTDKWAPVELGVCGDAQTAERLGLDQYMAVASSTFPEVTLVKPFQAGVVTRFTFYASKKPQNGLHPVFVKIRDTGLMDMTTDVYAANSKGYTFIFYALNTAAPR
jgi:hypothetical protein